MPDKISVLLVDDHSLVRRGVRRLFEKEPGNRGGGEAGEVVAGETVLDSQLNRPVALKGDRDEHLTPRELEILQMIVEGKSNKEIAAVLDLSANTVAVHRANIMDALGIHKTAELVVYAIRNGLVNLP